MKTFKHLFITLCFSLIFLIFMTSSIYASNNLLHGIDVSEWRGAIDFQLVKQSGIDVVYIRVAEGINYEDRYWRQNYKSALAADLKIGFYHYVTAVSEYEAQEQAKYFYSLIKDHHMDCLPVMDFENFSNLSIDEINRVATTYLETLESLTDIRPMLYSDAYNTSHVWSDFLTQYPLWVAHYDVPEPETTGPWHTWIGFQFSDTGFVNGVTGDVDMDYFKDSVLITIPTPNPESTTLSPHHAAPSIIYTVKPGDTLWQIASTYHATIQSIVRRNHIQNPNLIYPGQQLIISSSVPLSPSITSPIPSLPIPITYTVQPGDTLWQIAINHHTTIQAIVQRNHIQNPNLIYPGQVLILPIY